MNTSRTSRLRAPNDALGRCQQTTHNRDCQVRWAATFTWGAHELGCCRVGCAPHSYTGCIQNNKSHFQ